MVHQATNQVGLLNPKLREAIPYGQESGLIGEMDYGRFGFVQRYSPDSMHPDLLKVFQHLINWNIAIFGSSVRDYNKAHDIDVLFPASVNFREVCKKLGIMYRGGQPTERGTIRRAILVIPGIAKQVQLCQSSEVEDFSTHPHAILLRDGRVLNEGVFYKKPLDKHKQ